MVVSRKNLMFLLHLHLKQLCEVTGLQQFMGSKYFTKDNTDWIYPTVKFRIQSQGCSVRKPDNS